MVLEIVAENIHLCVKCQQNISFADLLFIGKPNCRHQLAAG
jgi:hypothetical protein